jgi:hypothetical protein
MEKLAAHVARPPGRDLELLPNQGAVWRSGSRQRKHQALLRNGHGYRDMNYLLLKARRLAATKTQFLVLQKAA